jgi:uncharacterized protein (TIGR03790 family)
MEKKPGLCLYDFAYNDFAKLGMEKGMRLRLGLRSGLRKALIGLILAAGAVRLWAAGPGDSVVVIYNSHMPESRQVAAHYAFVRRVPAAQVLGLALPAGENMTRTEYREELQMPLLNWLEKEKLFVFQPGGVPPDTNTPPQSLKASKIRYAVLCFGVPLRILEDPQLVEPDLDSLPPEMRSRNGAAVDSEVTLLPWSRQKMRLAGPLNNPCFAVTNAALLNPLRGVLIVARLDGPNATVAGSLVDKALQAETNGLWGRAYFDLRGITNGSYKLGDDWLRAAAEAARRYGFETVVDDRPETFPAAFPMSQIALYAGWYDGNVSGPFTRPPVEFMPGAFAYHLHSFSAHTLRSTNEYWCGPLLAEGVTATMGCIDEPYLDATPDMQVFFNRWLLLGFTYGEAACAAQAALSWQTTVVGDPLYRPFGGDPQKLHQELLRRRSPWVEWSHLRWVDFNLAQGAPAADFVRYLEAEPAARQSAILAEKLAQLYLNEGKPDLAIKSFRQALALHPTPQTAVRLNLALGDLLVAAGQEAEALNLDDAFLKNNPDWPGALSLYKQMEVLAGKLGDKARAARYAADIDLLSPSR